MVKPRTVGELRNSGYRTLTVKQEMRKNLIEHIRKGEEHFPGIIGFEDTVLPIWRTPSCPGRILSSWASADRRSHASSDRW